MFKIIGPNVSPVILAKNVKDFQLTFLEIREISPALFLCKQTFGVLFKPLKFKYQQNIRFSKFQ